MRVGERIKIMQAAMNRESEVWLYSYADLITNLMAFFVIMFVVAHSKEGGWQGLQESIRSALNGKSVIEEPADALQDQLKKLQLLTHVSFQKTPKGAMLTIAGGLHFDSYSSTINAATAEVLSGILQALRGSKSSFRIDVEGHADAQPIGTGGAYPTNWELSAARAGAVVRFLSEAGVDPKKMRAIGMGDTKPISSVDQENRRVALVIEFEESSGEPAR